MLRRHALLIALLAGWAVTVQAQPVVTELARVDELREAGQFQEALETLESLQQESPNEAEILWRLSRTRVDIGELAPEEEREPYYVQAIHEAEAAVAADPQNAETHLALAIAAGRVGLISGTRTKVELSRTVKESLDRALELDPDLGIAYHVRGRWNYEVADLGFFSRAAVRIVYGGLPDASFEQAAEDFQRAIESEDNVINRLELGRTYMKLDEDAKARAELEHALSLPDSDPDDPAHKADARALLERLD